MVTLAKRRMSEEWQKEKHRASRRAEVVGEKIIEALGSFCEQNSEFAAAIANAPDSMTALDCIESTVENAGSGISDFEVYSRAVEYYFAGAKVHFHMEIDLGDGGFSNKSSTNNSDTHFSLSFDDILEGLL